MRSGPDRLARTGYRIFWVKMVAFGLLGLLLLTSCGGSSSRSNSTATTTVQPSPTNQIAASPEPTEQTATAIPPATSEIAAASSPAVSERPMGSAIPASAQESTSVLPPGVILATPIDEGPIDKDIPAEAPGPAFTPRLSDFDLDKDGFYTYNELQTAITTVFPTYRWPANYYISAQTILSRMTPNPSVTYNWEAGAEQTAIGMPHFCAWALTLRDAIYDDNPELAAQSIDKIRTVSLANPMFIYIRENIENAVDKAELGDPADLQGRIDAMHCDTTPWESATPAASSSQWISPVSHLVHAADLGRRWDDDLA